MMFVTNKIWYFGFLNLLHSDIRSDDFAKLPFNLMALLTMKLSK